MLRIVLLVLSACLKRHVLVAGEYYGEEVDDVMQVWSDMLVQDDRGDDITDQFKALTIRVKNLVDRGLILPMGEETVWSHHHHLTLMKYCIPESHYTGASMHDLPSQVHAQEYHDYMRSHLKGVDKQAEDFITRQHRRFLGQEERDYREGSEGYAGLYYRNSRSSYQKPSETEDNDSTYVRNDRTPSQQPESYSDYLSRIQSPPSPNYPGSYGSSYSTMDTSPSYREPSYSGHTIDPYYRTPSAPTTDEGYEDEVQDRTSYSTRPTSPSLYGSSDKFKSCHRLANTLGNGKTQYGDLTDQESRDEAPKEERRNRWRRHHRHHLSNLFGSKQE